MAGAQKLELDYQVLPDDNVAPSTFASEPVARRNRFYIRGPKEQTKTMQKSWLRWRLWSLIALIVVWLAARWPYFPGDVALARLIQSISGEQPGWARFITSLVSSPWIYVLLALAAALAWRLAGWRGAVVTLLSETPPTKSVA